MKKKLLFSNYKEDTFNYTWEELSPILDRVFDGHLVIVVGDITYPLAKDHKESRGGKVGTFTDLFYEIVENGAKFRFGYDELGNLYLHSKTKKEICNMNMRCLTEYGERIYDKWFYSLKGETKEERKDLKPFKKADLEECHKLLMENDKYSYVPKISQQEASEVK